MTRRISLSLTFHNHQPVGNFGWVIEEVCQKAYEPMIAALERHPGVRVALHYTGPLLEWLVDRRPELVARIRALADRGQVEIVGGALYEPILAALPDADRVAQLLRMNEAIEQVFGVGPRGAWLAERVWEPDLPVALAGAGCDWTILDDAHFLAAGVREDGLFGHHMTEDRGRSVAVFGTSQALRYRVPFGAVDDVIAWLRAAATDAGDQVAVVGDDGEKFGAWPTTWEHCWGANGWVERFLDALDANASWLATVTPSAWIDAHPPVGRVYLPTASYAEMGEWVLPPDDARLFGERLRHARSEGDPAARFLRGGFWRNFLVRYREVNDLHKQMLRASAKVAEMADGRERVRALDHLHRGQSNDCYWHGLFGGVYIAHLRAATHAHLIAADDIADRDLGAATRAALLDLDLDGMREVLLTDQGQVVTVDLAEGAGIGSWDIRAARHALLAVMRRRPEAYHARITAAEDPPAGEPKTRSIHDEPLPEPELAGHLVYDAHERRSGLIRFLDPGVTSSEIARAGARELGDFVDGAFGVTDLAEGRLVTSRLGTVETPDGPIAVLVERVLTLGGSRLAPTLGVEVRVSNRGGRSLACRIAMEWAMTMLGGGGNPAAWWELAGERTRHDAPGEASTVTEIGQGNDFVGLAIAATVAPAADAWWSPIETISNSESGFERAYQGSALLLSWPLDLAPGATASFRVDHHVRVRQDLDADEAQAWSPPFRAAPVG